MGFAAHTQGRQRKANLKSDKNTFVVFTQQLLDYTRHIDRDFRPDTAVGFDI